MTRSYDYIVIGGGTAGCVMASRLSENPDVTVLLLEAGPAHGPDAVADPAAFPTLLGSEIDWRDKTVPREGTGSVHAWSRGRVLGGSSSINAMAHIRGHRTNYDGWLAAGATGWGYADLLPFFKRSETAPGRGTAYRGTEGPLLVGPSPEVTPAAQAFVQAVGEAGYPISEDINGSDQEGAYWFDQNVVDGLRQSAADAYLRPILSRPNLRVTTDAFVRHLIVTNGTCRGVEYVVDGRLQRAEAIRETVLTAGTVGSAQLLMVSGIGPAQHLRDVGVEVVADLQGVGENLQDHVQSGLVYAAAQPMRSGVNGFCPAGALLRSDPSLPCPNVQLLLMDFSQVRSSARVPAQAYTIAFVLLAPASRGSIRLTGPDPEQPLLIDPNYYGVEDDLDTMLELLPMARAVGEAPALRPWRGSEALPGAESDRAACRDHIRRTARTCFHPVGSCRMGTDDAAVVDPDLRVRGVDRLRVADASIMPAIVTANTNATVLAIAERAASLISGRTTT